MYLVIQLGGIIALITFKYTNIYATLMLYVCFYPYSKAAATSATLPTSILSVTPSLSAQTSPSSGLTATMTTAKNSLQKHEVKREDDEDKESDEEDEESSSSNEEDGSDEDNDSDSNSDENEVHKKSAAVTKTTMATSKTITTAAVRTNHPVARKEIKLQEQEETSSSSGSDDSSSSSDDD